ncbi:uncharacterized protein LOC135388679 [Ornithodoros turicata]|uniref:uncharacterized protein LOC135388679 n=1 Tax=Ornithodoros turicata TaxID=34597 RepID=UPI00313A1B22
MSPLTTILTTVIVVTLAKMSYGTPKYVMEGFTPVKFAGKWWVDSFSQAIYGDTDRCAHFTIQKNHDDVYKITAEYVSEDNELVELAIDVTEDDRHPARFFLKVGDDTIMEIAIVGSDYDNWAVVWAKSGTVASYNVVTRKPNMESQFQGPIQEVLDKVGVKKSEFKTVPNEDCTKKDTI